ncbi:hypothetical protein D9M71_617600 [compost metagenome]
MLGVGLALRNSQCADHEICDITPWPAAPGQLPVQPDTLTIAAHETVALMGVAMNHTTGRSLFPFEGRQFIEGMTEQLRRLVHPLRQQSLVIRFAQIDFDVVIHAQQPVAVHRIGHRDRQPTLRV